MTVIFMKTFASLSTPYKIGDIPHSYHPDPMFCRESFLSLNGSWDFKVYHKKKLDFSGKISVPFPPESELSGVGRITKADDLLVYERKFSVDEINGHILLHFGACDNESEIFINGNIAGKSIGGYLPFTFDITSLVKIGENLITVKVKDSLDKTYPYGKQSHRRGGMWYTPISGIWQSVWLENLPENYIKGIIITPTLTSVKIKVEGGENEKIITLDGQKYSFAGSETTIEIANPNNWTPENPHLYYFTVESGKDKVNSYFALREIGSKKLGDKCVLTLNGKPYFFHGLLDQGYFPDGIFTPASEEAFRDDILRMKSLGFNMLRKHIKIEPKIFYYYCDLYGMAVFQDMVNNGHYSFIYDTALPTVGLKNLPRSENKRTREVFYENAKGTLAHLYNHPSVVYYTVFNEGWGQHNIKMAYKTLKKLDSSRIFDSASGWFGKDPSDVQSEHVYFKKAKFSISPDKPTVLSEFGGYSCAVMDHVFNREKIYGYKICKTPEILTKELEKLYLDEIVPLINNGLSASVLTQLSDVEDETNGMLTYDRKVLKVNKDVMLSVAEKLKSAFYGIYSKIKAF